MNTQSSIFRLKRCRNCTDRYEQLISQKQGLSNNEKYLAVNWRVSDALMLTGENNRRNRFFIRPIRN